MEDEKKEFRTFTLYEVYALLEYLGVDAARALIAKAEGKPAKYGSLTLGQNEAILNRILADVPKEGQAAMIEAILRNKVMVHISPIQTLSVQQAIKILGANKVITADAAARAWQEPIVNGLIHYTEATLKQVAAENATGQTDWRLVFVSGKSLRRQYELRGTDPAPKKQPCFRKNITWWLDDKENYWAKQDQQAGYYLIDFNGRWKNFKWDSQETELRKLGSLYERVNPAIFSEAILINFMVNKERLAENWYHLSGVALSVADFVGIICVGCFSVSGIYVDGSYRDNSSPHLRVCLFRRFDV